ncbi:hypothetical protein [Brevundimonas aurantiaca]|uniref:hypothetical protein n=1 Tax=Brevundimonas aurantiaca TaxID=74316 RepID=UPI001CD3DF91|nr:hypothetical protein [Brevundimonas aurantiaca]
MSQVGGVGDHARLALDRVEDPCGLAVQMKAQGLHLIPLPPEVLDQASGRAAGGFRRLVQTLGLLGQGLPKQGHVAAGALGRKGGVVDVGPKRGQDLPRLICGESRGSHQRFSHSARAPRLGRQAGALENGVGQDQRQAGGRQGEQDVDGDPERIQVRPACADLIGRP